MLYPLSYEGRRSLGFPHETVRNVDFVGRSLR